MTINDFYAIHFHILCSYNIIYYDNVIMILLLIIIMINIVQLIVSLLTVLSSLIVQ